MPIVRILLILLALASPAWAENGAGDAAAAQNAAKDFRVYVEGVASDGGRPDLTRPEVAEMLARVYDLDAFNALPPPHGTDLPWLLDWLDAANSTYKLIMRYGSRSSTEPDLAALERNMAEYQDQIAPALGFMIRAMAREAVAGTRFMAALKPEERTRLRQEGLDGVRRSSGHFVLAAICSVSGSKPANARVIAAAVRDTRETWAGFFFAPERAQVIEQLAALSKQVSDETARTDLAAFKDALQAAN